MTVTRKRLNLPHRNPSSLNTEAKPKPKVSNNLSNADLRDIILNFQSTVLELQATVSKNKEAITYLLHYSKQFQNEILKTQKKKT